MLGRSISSLRGKCSDATGSKWYTLYGVVFLVVLLGASSFAAEVITDSTVYDMGSTVGIDGFTFGSSETVTLQVTEPDGTPVTGDAGLPWDATSDGTGGFGTSWILDYQGTSDQLTVTAVGQSSGLTATTSFVAGATNLDQLKNGTTTVPPEWSNGNINTSNSCYSEGRAVPYRAFITDQGSGTPHYFTIEMEWTKSSIHAFDFLASYDFSEDSAIDLAGGPCGNVGTSAPEDCTDPADSLEFPDPTLTSNYSGSIPGDFFPDTFQYNNAHYLMAYNAVIDSVGDYYFGGTESNRTWAVEVYYTQTDTGTVGFYWGGNLAQGDPDHWGYGNGSASVSGAPYHMRMKSFDGGGGGGQDRSVQGATICLPPAAIIIINADSLCYDIDTTYIAYDTSDANDWLWRITGGTIIGDSTLSSVEFSVDDTATTVTIELIACNANGGCPGDFCCTDVSVTLPTMSCCQLTCNVDPPSDAVCDGESQEFCAVPSGGTPPYTYLWTNGATTQCITVGVAGQYQVTVTDANGCETACSGDLTVNPVPSCSVDPPSAAVCDGETQEFCAVPSGGTPPYTYLWTTGATTQCITVGVAGQYEVTVTDANGCETTCSGDLTVNPNPDCSVNPPSAAVCDGETEEFCAVPSGGTPPYTYLWTTGATTQCITVGVAGQYQVTVTDANGCETACSGDLTVNPNPDCSVDPPSASVCDGESQEFCAVPSGGTPPYTYLWTTGATTQCITVGVAGQYQVTVTDANGCETACSGDLTVYPNPDCSVDPPSASVCDGESQEFCAVPSGGTPPYTYLWTNSATTQCITVGVAGQYEVTVTDANGCETTCSGDLTVNPVPSCSVDPPSAAVCDGETEEFCAVPSGGTPPYTYLWTNGATTQCIIVGVAGQYDVTVTDANGCETTCSGDLTVYPNPDLTCEGDELTCVETEVCAIVTVNNPGDLGLLSYAWSPEPVSGQGTTQACYDTPGTKTVVVTDVDSGCKDSCEAVITQDIVTPDLTCEGDALTCDSTLASATVTVNNPRGNEWYVWSPAPVSGQGTDHARYDAPGDKTVVVTFDDNGCDSTCTAVITEDIETPDLTCEGDELTCDSLLASATVTLSNPRGTESYVWSPEPVSGQGTDLARYDAPGDKTVVVTFADNGCDSTCTAIITEVPNSPPVATCPAPVDTFLCDLQEICISGFSCSDVDLNLASCVPSIGTLVGDEVCFTPTAEGTYDIILTATDDCNEVHACTTQVTVALNRPPVATCPNSVDTLICENGEICIAGFSCDDPDGNLSSCVPSRGTLVGDEICFTTNGSSEYDIILTATDDCGLVAACTTQVTITVNSPPEVVCPGDTAIVTCNVDATVCVGAFSATDPDDNLKTTLLNGLAYTPGDPYCFVPDSGVNLLIFTAIDSCDASATCTTIVDVEALPEEECHLCPSFTIEKTHNTIQGMHEYVTVTLDSGTVEMGGYDFLIAYDASALNLQAVIPGPSFYDPAPDGCGWEYFSYRQGPCGSCAGNCPSGQVRVFGLAETNNGPNHPDCFLPDSLPATLFTLDFLVTNDRTFECQYVPIRFFWCDCGDNTVSSVDGEILYVSDHVYEFEGTEITDSTYGFPTYFGVQQGCLDPEPGKPTPIKCLDFWNGGIDIVCADSIDARGDINLNGNSNEIADAVLFSNYFIKGISVFNVNVDGQIAASDVNADGITLSVADLVYLIRIIVGDALPYFKQAPIVISTNLAGGVLSVDAPLGAAWLVVEGKQQPVLLATNMEMKYGYDGEAELTRILVYSLERNQTFDGAFLAGLEGEVVKFEAATYEGIPVTAKLVPDQFALYPSYPNPFNPVTTIAFALAEATDYELTIYNALGREVQTFRGHSTPGIVEIQWDAGGHASGIYLYRLKASTYTETRKMVLLK